MSSALAPDPDTPSPLLERLGIAGLITRGRDRSDERNLSVELTDRGRELRSVALEVPPAIVAWLAGPTT